MSRSATLQPSNSGNPGCMTIVNHDGSAATMERIAALFPELKAGGYENQLRAAGGTDLIDVVLHREDDRGMAALWYETNRWRTTDVFMRRTWERDPSDPDGTLYVITAQISPPGATPIRLKFTTTWRQWSRFDLRRWAARAVTQALRA